MATGEWIMAKANSINDLYAHVLQDHVELFATGHTSSMPYRERFESFNFRCFHRWSPIACWLRLIIGYTCPEGMERSVIPPSPRIELRPSHLAWQEVGLPCQHGHGPRIYAGRQICNNHRENRYSDECYIAGGRNSVITKIGGYQLCSRSTHCWLPFDHLFQ